MVLTDQSSRIASPTGEVLVFTLVRRSIRICPRVFIAVPGICPDWPSLKASGEHWIKMAKIATSNLNLAASGTKKDIFDFGIK